MKGNIQTFLGLFLIAVLVSGIISFGFIQEIIAKKSTKDRKIIIKKIDRVMESKKNWGNIGKLNLTKGNSTDIIPIVNKSRVVIILPPINNETGNVTEPPIVIQPPINNQTGNDSGALPPCPKGFHLEPDLVCVPDSIVNPKPPDPPIENNTTPTTTKLCVVGDLQGSAVPSAMNKANCEIKIGLGDLGYANDLKYFKALKFQFCVPGNHDTREDGSASIEAETYAYCGEHWNQTVANGHTMVIGLNTNGDPAREFAFYKSVVKNLNLKPEVKAVIVFTHKNGDVFGNAHHPPEATLLYGNIESTPLPKGVILIEDNAHNHNIASKVGTTIQKYISGGGGKNHYTCPTKLPSNGWSFCDSSHFGFLEQDINNNNGEVKSQFIDTSGNILK